MKTLKTVLFAIAIAVILILSNMLITGSVPDVVGLAGALFGGALVTWTCWQYVVRARHQAYARFVEAHLSQAVGPEILRVQALRLSTEEKLRLFRDPEFRFWLIATAQELSATDLALARGLERLRNLEFPERTLLLKFVRDNRELMEILIDVLVAESLLEPAVVRERPTEAG